MTLSVKINETGIIIGADTCTYDEALLLVQQIKTHAERFRTDRITLLKDKIREHEAQISILRADLSILETDVAIKAAPEPYEAGCVDVAWADAEKVEQAAEEPQKAVEVAPAYRPLTKPQKNLVKSWFNQGVSTKHIAESCGADLEAVKAFIKELSEVA